MENIKVRFAPSPTGPLHIRRPDLPFLIIYCQRYNGKMVLQSKILTERSS